MANRNKIKIHNVPYDHIMSFEFEYLTTEEAKLVLEYLNKRYKDKSNNYKYIFFRNIFEYVSIYENLKEISEVLIEKFSDRELLDYYVFTDYDIKDYKTMYEAFIHCITDDYEEDWVKICDGIYIYFEQ